jgi:hypothetical protein
MDECGSEHGNSISHEPALLRAVAGKDVVVGEALQPGRLARREAPVEDWMNRKGVVAGYESERRPRSVKPLVGVAEVLAPDLRWKLRWSRQPSSFRDEAIPLHDSLAVPERMMLLTGRSAGGNGQVHDGLADGRPGKLPADSLIVVRWVGPRKLTSQAASEEEYP